MSAYPIAEPTEEQASASFRESLAMLRQNWQVLTAATVGWALDAFDLTILLFMIPHLTKVFDVSVADMALVAALTGVTKVIGTVAFGAAADRIGRKLPFMVAIIWFAFFCGLSGLAWSYASFLVLRLLFGFGFGGEWASSAALMMESIPPKARQLATGIMFAGYEVGFLLAAFCFGYLFPILGWRAMFFIGVLPALLTIFVRISVKESPEWLARRKEAPGVRHKLKITPAVIQAWAFMLLVNFMTWAIFGLYPTFLIQVRGLSPSQVFPFIAAWSIASIIGKPLAGFVAHRFGERVTLITYLIITIPCTILLTMYDDRLVMALGAVLMGLFANSVFGIVPIYIARRFPTETRGFGTGIGFAMSGIGGLAPYIVAMLTGVYGLTISMTASIMITAFLAAITASFQTDRWIAMPEAAFERRRLRAAAGPVQGVSQTAD